MERTFILLKPDCVSRGLIGRVITRFEEKGLKMVGIKIVKLKNKHIDGLYGKYKDRDFFTPLVKFMKKTPVVCVVLEGKNSIEVVRKMVGVTTGREAESGTIRGDFSMSMRMNIIHAADTPEMVEKEIGMFFKPKEVLEYKTLLFPIRYGEEEVAFEVERKGKPRKIPGKETEPRT